MSPGPMNVGLRDAALDERVQWAMAAVDMDLEHYELRNTNNVWGENALRRRVLAMQPQVLIR